MSDSVQPHRWQPTRLPHPWDSPGKNTVVGCHFLLQCKKLKNESEVAQSCPTLSDPMDYSLPGSSIHGIFQARVLEWDAIAFSKTVTITERFSLPLCSLLFPFLLPPLLPSPLPFPRLILSFLLSVTICSLWSRQLYSHPLSLTHAPTELIGCPGDFLYSHWVVPGVAG